MYQHSYTNLTLEELDELITRLIELRQSTNNETPTEKEIELLKFDKERLKHIDESTDNNHSDS